VTDSEQGAIGLAEKVLTLLDQGSFTATYKYAVLLALLDLCLEQTSRDGKAPTELTTCRLAAKVAELYWPHSVPYRGERILKQNGGRADSQAAILTAIRRFRERHAPDPSATLSQARYAAHGAFAALLRAIEWILIQMPLPRLQVVGDALDPFLYRIAWGQDIKRGPISAYQRGVSGAFDNRIRLLPGVGDSLVRLNGLLRPFIQQQWARLVAQLNQLEENKLETFLFGVERISTDPVRPALQALQKDVCFYCGRALGESLALRPQVDHFIPWARYPDNGVENLVVAHEGCNHYKRDFLATTDHVRRWRGRMAEQGTALEAIAADARWAHHPAETESVARAIYLHLPPGARLWVRERELLPLDRQILLEAFE
jgi:5-methylcytosine-specific restriction endonuclease McrA